jgi:dethiobiotin synthetase
MTACFITSSGTDMGKTFVGCLMSAGLRLSHQKVDVIKPVISGFTPEDPESCDCYKLKAAATGRRPDMREMTAMCPWRFLPPIAPHLAAERVGRRIEAAKIVEFSRREMTRSVAEGHTLLIEGVGGIMVPLNEQETTLDWMKALSLPTVLVVGSYLGSLSHTLSALKCLQAEGIPVASIIISESAHSPVHLQESATIIRQLAPKETPVLTVPRMMLDVPKGAFHDTVWQSLLHQAPEFYLWLQAFGKQLNAGGQASRHSREMA